MDYIDIVFDGPPSHESGRFVEVENIAGASISVGEWLQRADGYWVLRLPQLPKPTDPIGDALRALPVIGIINVDDPKDPRHKEWPTLNETYDCPVHGLIEGSSECPRC